MLIKLILIFTITPLIELAILIKLGTVIGLARTLLIVILTGITGAVLAKMQGIQILYKIKNEINNGVVPAGYLFDGFLIFAAGLLLITPGLLTDIIGFLILIPHTRNSFKKYLTNLIRDRIRKGEVNITFFGR
jgi:UPF0716 protein FxsA